jgi:hypothetical protein
VCSQAATRYPDLISTEPNTHHDGRVHAHVSSNAPRRFSAVPYSLRAPNLTAVVPIRWEELAAFDRPDGVDADAMLARVEQLGDVFASEVRAIGVQRFADLGTQLPNKIQANGSAYYRLTILSFDDNIGGWSSLTERPETYTTAWLQSKPEKSSRQRFGRGLWTSLLC